MICLFRKKTPQITSFVRKYVPNSQKAFTLVELILVIALLGIILSIAIVNFGAHISFSSRVDTINAHKIIVNSIDLWVADNKDPRQRPANFQSKNSQGRTVVDFFPEKIPGSESMTENRIVNNNLDIQFTNGVLITKSNTSNEKFYHSVFPSENDKDGVCVVTDYSGLLEDNFIIETDYKLIYFDTTPPSPPTPPTP